MTVILLHGPGSWAGGQSPQVQTDAEKIAKLKELADAGDAKGQLGLGLFLAFAPDPSLVEVGESYLLKADAQGQTGAASVLALIYMNGWGGKPKDDAKALPWWRKAAESGDPMGQYNLGSFFYEGRAVPQDYSRAVSLFRAAADKGFSEAEADLGLAYYEGKGVEANPTIAATWFRKAAEQGLSKGQALLAVALFQGTGVPQDYVQAHMWANLAAAKLTGELGRRIAGMREALASKMTPEQVAEAQRMARDWTTAFENRPKK